MERSGLHLSLTGARSDGRTRTGTSTREAQIAALKEEIAAHYDLLREPVLRYLSSIGLGAQEGEDVVQEAFLRAFEDLLKRPERSHNVRAWIFNVAHNLAINHAKRNRRVQYGLDLAQLDSLPRSSAVPSAEEEVLKQEQIERTRAAIAKLTAQEQQCLQLRAQGLRFREIAEIVGTGISAAAEAVARGCRKLAD